MSTTGLDAAQRGTAMHAFMQFCDFKSAAADLDGEISRLANHSYLTAEQAQALDKKALVTLFVGDLGRRLLSADKVYRELNLSSFCRFPNLSIVLPMKKSACARYCRLHFFEEKRQARADRLQNRQG
ncbi:MAG: hypothetical protein L6V88_04570 [Anaerotruncus sp.]|nr:MAG: hypothetical protein L6V88_04570 [Anaerotruncus sp.]